MLASQVLLVLAACALGGAALRVAHRVGALGPVEQILAAAPIAGAFAVCWTLATGLAGISGSAIALAAGPLVAWVAARLMLAGAPSLASTLQARWNDCSRVERTIAFALAGLAAGCVIEVAREPAFGLDAMQYHLADVVGWLHSGHAGAIQTFNYDLPEGYYPVTGEVLLTWFLGISKSFAPLAIWSPAVAALTFLGLWSLLHSLRVPRSVRVPALAAFATLPLVGVGLNLIGPGTDLLAVMWLACTAALCARAGARPALLAPALVAVGLGGGTKTTVLPLAAVALLFGAWAAREKLRSAGGWLIAGAGVGLLVGVPWYVRNTIMHGWPLWPFSSGPGSDKLPRLLRLFHESFLQRPKAAVDTLGSLYAKTLAGGLALAAGAVAVPLLARSRAALLAAAVALGSLLVWAAAPFTGLAPGSGAEHTVLAETVAVSTVRYILAPFAACIVGLAVAARDAKPLFRRVAIALLLGATVWSLVKDVQLGYPTVPRLTYLIIGAAAGALTGLVAPALRHTAAPQLARAATALLAVAFLALSAPNWLARESVDGSYEANVLAFMLHQPSFTTGSQPIAFAPTVLASLAGPRLRHPLELIPARQSCDKVRARLERGWVVVWPGQYEPGVTTSFDAYNCLSHDRPIYAAGGAFIYGPSS